MHAARRAALYCVQEHLVGPKLYEANWMDLQDSKYLARVECAEVGTAYRATPSPVARSSVRARVCMLRRRRASTRVYFRGQTKPQVWCPMSPKFFELYLKPTTSAAQKRDL